MPPRSKESAASGGNQSAETSARVLRALAEAPGAIGLKVVAEAAGISPSNARRYLIGMMLSGLVEQDAGTGHYDLGPLALRIGLAAIYRLNVVKSSLPVIARLRDDIGKTVLLTIWGEHGPTLVHWEEALPPVVISVRLGSVLPLLSSASGRVFLAWLPKAQTAPLVKEERRRLETVSASDVQDIVADTRATGFGRFGTVDTIRTVNSLAAPIFDHEGKLAAAIATYGSGSALDSSPDSEPAKLLATAAREISERLGFAEER